MPRQICVGRFEPPLLVDTLYGTCTHVCIKVTGTRRSKARHKFKGSKAQSIFSTQPIERNSSSHPGAWLDWHRVGQGDIHPLHSLAPCTLEFKGELSAYLYVNALRRELWWVWQTEREPERGERGELWGGSGQVERKQELKVDFFEFWVWVWVWERIGRGRQSDVNTGHHFQRSLPFLNYCHVDQAVTLTDLPHPWCWPLNCVRYHRLACAWIESVLVWLDLSFLALIHCHLHHFASFSPALWLTFVRPCFNYQDTLSFLLNYLTDNVCLARSFFSPGDK